MRAWRMASLCFFINKPKPPMPAADTNTPASAAALLLTTSKLPLTWLKAASVLFFADMTIFEFIGIYPVFPLLAYNS